MLGAILVAIVIQAGAPQALTLREQEQASQHFRNGMQALSTERWDRAESEFKATLKVDPLHDGAFYGLGQVHMIRREFDEAIRDYLGSREAFLTNARLRASGQVTTGRRIRDEIQALEDDNRRLERAGSRGNPNLVADLQRNRVRIGQLQAQLTLAVGAPIEVPAGLSMALGSAYFRVGDFPGAEREYLEAIRVDPGFGEAHNNLAVVCMLSGRLDQADKEIALAEQAGFTVSADLKADLKKRKGGVATLPRAASRPRTSARLA